MPNKGMNALTAQSDEWETPAWLYDALDHELHSISTQQPQRRTPSVSTTYRVTEKMR